MPYLKNLAAFFIIVWLSILTSAQGKSCTKEIIHTYTILKMDEFTHTLKSVIKSKKVIVIMCCEGYRELEPKRQFRYQLMTPKCEPVCNTPCGHGVCSSPNHCVCDVGHHLSDVGSCVPSTEEPKVASTTVRSMTTQSSSRVQEITSLAAINEPIKSRLPTVLEKPQGQSCTKEIIHTSKALKMDPNTHRLVYNRVAKKVIVIMCCEGYRELEPIRTFKNQQMKPNCEPICTTPCGHGVCSSPNHCVCDVGYQRSDHGSCVASEEKREKNLDSTTVRSVTFKSAPDFETQSPTHQTTTSAAPVLFKARSTTIVDRPKEVEEQTTVAERSQEENRTGIVFQVQNSTTVSKKLRTTTFEPKLEVTVTKFCAKCHQGECISGICICPKGFNQTKPGLCQPVCDQSCQNGHCSAPNHCECVNGYTYDSESNKCKPLCNGKIYGCIHGACVGYNQCRCDNGMVLTKDELFHCKEAMEIESIRHTLNWRPYLWLLLIPAAIVCVSLYIVFRRWKLVKANRLEAQSESFSEVRYYNPQNGHSLTDGQDCQQASGKKKLLSSGSLQEQDTFRYNGNTVIIRA